MLWIIFFILLGVIVLSCVCFIIGYTREKVVLTILGGLVLTLSISVLGLYATIMFVLWTLKLAGIL